MTWSWSSSTKTKELEAAKSAMRFHDSQDSQKSNLSSERSKLATGFQGEEFLEIDYLIFKTIDLQHIIKHEFYEYWFDCYFFCVFAMWNFIQNKIVEGHKLVCTGITLNKGTKLFSFLFYISCPAFPDKQVHSNSKRYTKIPFSSKFQKNISKYFSNSSKNLDKHLF